MIYVQKYKNILEFGINYQLKERKLYVIFLDFNH